MLWKVFSSAVAAAAPSHCPLAFTLLVFCRDINGTGQPPFAVFVGNEDASAPGSYTVLDNTNCTAYSAQFTANSQVLAVPCTRQGRYVVIKSNIGPLVLCEVQVYGESAVTHCAASANG